jgi:broad specificity phosphatase PhoE
MEAEHILIVSHGSFGRALRSIFHPDIPFANKIPNAQIIRFL